MAFITASDEFGNISLTLFPDIYKNISNLKRKSVVKIRGRVEKRFDKYQIVVNELKILN